MTPAVKKLLSTMVMVAFTTTASAGGGDKGHHNTGHSSSGHSSPTPTVNHHSHGGSSHQQQQQQAIAQGGSGTAIIKDVSPTATSGSSSGAEVDFDGGDFAQHIKHRSYNFNPAQAPGVGTGEKDPCATYDVDTFSAYILSHGSNKTGPARQFFSNGTGPDAFKAMKPDARQKFIQKRLEEIKRSGGGEEALKKLDEAVCAALGTPQQRHETGLAVIEMQTRLGEIAVEGAKPDTKNQIAITAAIGAWGKEAFDQAAPGGREAPYYKAGVVPSAQGASAPKGGGNGVQDTYIEYATGTATPRPSQP